MLAISHPGKLPDEAPSMSWAYYNGGLTDLSPGTKDVYDGARATAMMMSIDNESTFRVTLGV
jgi:hypothetical protein